MGRPVAAVGLTPQERRTLQAWSRLVRGVPNSVARRARIILMAADGRPSVNIADQLRLSQQTVCMWRGRFLARRLDGLWTARDRALDL
jgi:hypothetical protein